MSQKSRRLRRRIDIMGHMTNSATKRMLTAIIQARALEVELAKAKGQLMTVNARIYELETAPWRCLRGEPLVYDQIGHKLVMTYTINLSLLTGGADRGTDLAGYCEAAIGEMIHRLRADVAKGLLESGLLGRCRLG